VKCVLAALLLCTFAARAADETNPPALSPSDAWVPGHAATLRLLNKLDSTVQSLTFGVGETQKVQSLTITLLACDIRPPDLPRDATAHLAITDARPGMDPYDGWILKNEPAINMLEHPIYDVQLASCS
jgi:hypothetical protein